MFTDVNKKCLEIELHPSPKSIGQTCQMHEYITVFYEWRRPAEGNAEWKYDTKGAKYIYP